MLPPRAQRVSAFTFPLLPITRPQYDLWRDTDNYRLYLDLPNKAYLDLSTPASNAGGSDDLIGVLHQEMGDPRNSSFLRVANVATIVNGWESEVTEWYKLHLVVGEDGGVSVDIYDSKYSLTTGTAEANAYGAEGLYT